METQLNQIIKTNTYEQIDKNTFKKVLHYGYKRVNVCQNVCSYKMYLFLYLFFRTQCSNNYVTGVWWLSPFGQADL